MVLTFTYALDITHFKTKVNELKHGLFILVFILFSLSVFSIKSYQPILEDPLTESWRWQSYPEINGEDIRCMTEGANKVMWFGLKDGVLRFDGYNWSKLNEKNGFNGQYVNKIITTKHKNVYAGARNGLFALKTTKWEQVYPFKPLTDQNFSPINALCELHDGSILAGIGKPNTHYAGLLLLRKNKATLFCASSSYAYYKKEFPTISIQIVPEDLVVNKHLTITSIYQDKEGRIWFVVYEPKTAGVVFCSKQLTNLSKNKQVYTEKDGVKIGRHSIITQIKDGAIWIVNIESRKPILIFKNGVWKKFKLSSIIGYNEVHTSILETNEDGLWIGGYSVLYVKKDGKWKNYSKPKTPIPNARIQIYQDSRGFIWILGYRYELVRNDYVGGKWNTYKYINYQCTTPDNKKWFISVDNRVVVNDGNTWYSFGTEDGLPDSPTRVFVTSTNALWIVGSDKSVAATATFDGKSWHKETHPALSWSIDERAIFEDSKHRLWVGCATDVLEDKGQKGGVLCLENPGNPKHMWKHYPSTDKLEFRNAYGIAESKDGRIWTGGTMLRYFKNNKWHDFYGADESEYRVDMVSNTPNGNLWAGYRTDGLASYNGKKWTSYTAKNGLLSNSIIDVYPISDNNVWVATDKDFSHFDGTTWTNNIFPKELTLIRERGNMKFEKNKYIWINNYSYEWKRQPIEHRAFTNEMRESFKTSRYEIGKKAPDTRITSYNKKVNYPGNSYITWTGEDSWRHTPTRRLSYSYRFNGGKWSPFKEQNNEMFLQLKSGDYVFEVRARDLDFNIDPSPARVEFEVEPPVWKQVWFITLIILFIIIIIYYQLRLQFRNDTLLDAKIELEHSNEKLSQQKEKTIRIAKREQESNQIRIKFFTHISHEFRTPLTLILNSLERILTLDPEKDKQSFSKHLTLMQGNSQQMLKLINQLMDFRKADNTTMKLELAKGNIVKHTEDIVNSFQSLIEANEIKLVFEKDSDIIIAWYDADKIDRILYNLISNAIKFTPEKGSIRISIKKLEITNSYQLMVEDTGIGIPADDLDKIFEPFYQANNEAFNNEKGTGIGLSMVYNMVALHHGSIEVKSSQIKSSRESSNQYTTCFTINLPLGNDFIDDENDISTVENADDTKLEESTESILNVLAPSIKGNSCILIIDDNSDIREMIVDILGENYDYIEAENGKIGVEKSLEFLPDLIISDVMMPVMDGIACCKAIKSNPLTSHIPVILLTANDNEDQMVSGFETGADAYITKPFNAKMLSLRVRNILENRTLLRQKFKNEISIEPKSITINSIDTDFIVKVMAIVDENMQKEDFDVEMLSKQMHISVRQLHNKLTALTDMSPGEFIRVYTLKRAAEALLKKQATISEIAYDFGFSNPKYFSKCFRQQFGISPSEYLERYS